MTIMAITVDVIEKINQLDWTNMQSAVRFIDFLLHEQQQTPRKTHVKLGYLKGRLKYISDDFDEPIEVFKEYM